MSIRRSTSGQLRRQPRSSAAASILQPLLTRLIGPELPLAPRCWGDRELARRSLSAAPSTGELGRVVFR
jgi:hypothetical protein